MTEMYLEMIKLFFIIGGFIALLIEMVSHRGHYPGFSNVGTFSVQPGKVEKSK